MESETITREIEIHAPVTEVWKAITQKDSLQEWFFAVNDFQAVEGFEFKFKAVNEVGSFPVTCKIISIEENKLLSYSWVYNEINISTIVTFEISGSKKISNLKFTHSGIENIPKEQKGLSRKDHERGWKALIDVALKNFVEKSWTAWQKFE